MSSYSANRASNSPPKLTPANNQFSRPVRTPNKLRSLYESGLSLRKIIGTTVSSPTAFDTLSSSRIFAYTAGAAAVVVSVDENLKYTQRFFRARPTAFSPNSTSCSPTTSAITCNDAKSRLSLGNSKEYSLPYSPLSTHSMSDWGESSTPKTWTSRERIKAVTCLSISRDGKLLAVGEVRTLFYLKVGIIFESDKNTDRLCTTRAYIFFTRLLF